MDQGDLSISIEPKQDYREAFFSMLTAHAARRRPVNSLRNPLVIPWGYGILAALTKGAILPQNPIWLIVLFGGVALWLILWVILEVRLPPLACPGCKANVEKDGRYCAECGSNRIEEGGFFTGRKCLSCDKRLDRLKGKNRLFKIHHCPGCGGYLHTEGI